MNEKFIYLPTSKVTFINQLTNEKWDSWKTWEECTIEEKNQINLSSIPLDCMLFDRDLPNTTLKERDEDYEKVKSSMFKKGIKYFYVYKSPKGYHIIAKFKDLDNFNVELRKEIKKYYISMFGCDEVKSSDNGLVAVPGKPHFKNGIVYDVFECFEGINDLNQEIIETCKKSIEENKGKLKQLNSKRDFLKYFDEDPFFLYIKNNIIPENSNRDITIFPNLAIAAVSSGKTKEEIDNILKPIIKNNFPKKKYNEFEGWYKKALNGEINDYNPFQINQWMITYSKNKKEVYDLKPINVEQLSKSDLKIVETDEFKFYWDSELDSIENSNTEWLVENWLPKGDICFIAGKAASFKTTICTHIAYCLSEGLPVFNKYLTKKCKVLYLNEENSKTIMKSIINRVKKGIGLENNKNNNIAFSMLENIRLDISNDLLQLIKFINQNQIEVLVCDSFRRFVGFDENNATDMNLLFNNLKAVRKACNNLTILILHHLKKENISSPQDARDTLRGSSDIVNSADSIISIKRKTGKNVLNIGHIKNRSGEEIENKIIIMDSGENEDMCYFYESSKELIPIDKSVSKSDKCADFIMHYLETHNVLNFRKPDVNEWVSLAKEDYTYNNIREAIKKLIDEGTLVTLGGSKNTTYSFQSNTSFDKKSEKNSQLI